MWHYNFVLLLVLTGIALPASRGQEIEGTQDGPCPNLGFKKRLQWYRLTGTWNEIMRFNSVFEPHQCHATHTYAGVPPNITMTIVTRNTDGSENPANVWPGVIGSDPNKRVMPNAFPSIIYPDPAGITIETIYTNYRNIHIYWTCTDLEDNKHISYVWIEAREGKNPSPRKIKTQLRRLEQMGIDTSRFWNVGDEYCTEE